MNLGASDLRHDLDFTWQFRYHPAMRFGCCWPLQIAPADVRRHGKTVEDVGQPRGRRQSEGSLGWGRHFAKLAQVFHSFSDFRRPLFRISPFRFDDLELILRSGRQIRLLRLRSKRGSPSRLSSRKRSVFVYSRHLDVFCWIYATNCTGPAQRLGCKVDVY